MDVPTAEVSYPDIRVSEEFLRQHEELLLFSLYSLLQAALRTPGAHDSDVISALEALIQTQRTLASGLFYETRPENTVALGIHRLFVASLDDYRKERQEHETSSELRDSEVLALLVFVLRLAQQNQNGKPRCRSFMDLLRHLTPDEGRVAEQTSSIII